MPSSATSGSATRRASARRMFFRITVELYFKERIQATTAAAWSEVSAMLLCMEAETGPFPSRIDFARLASDWLCTAAERKSWILFLFPTAVSPAPLVPWQRSQPCDLKMAPPAAARVGDGGF